MHVRTLLWLPHEEHPVSIWTRLRDEPDWPFVDGVPDQGVFTTKQIMAGELSITGIVHDRDGDWQFLDGDSATPEVAAVPDGEAALIAPCHDQMLSRGGSGDDDDGPAAEARQSGGDGADEAVTGLSG
jgi:hypothetical protein